MKKTLISLCSLFFLFGTSGHSGTHPDVSKPNIVLITIDDLGWADVGCNGSTYYETPHIDRLAAEGMRFTQAYAAAAICSPTRAALMTGKAPARLGITDWIRARFQGGEIPANKVFIRTCEGTADDSLLCPANPLWLPLEETTIAEVLKGQGYTTAHIGKWHLGADDWYPEKQGFDVNIGGCDYGQPPSYFDPYVNKKVNGIPNLPARKEGEFLEDRLADEAASFIIANKDRPFFLNMSDYGVHTPIAGKPELVEKYKNKPTTQQDNPVYAALIEGMDELVGKITRTIDSLGLGENTLIVFTSDNGGLLRVTDNTPLRSGKGFPYEGGIRVPLVVRFTGRIPVGSVNETPVISQDWFPTFCELSGAAIKGLTVDGTSLKSVLFDNADLDRHALYWHFPHYRYKEEVPYSVIRKDHWKLIKRYQGQQFELFNLAEDPAETQNLAHRYTEQVHLMDHELMNWLQQVGAALPKENKRKK